jgi:hypothetical protein
MSVDHSVAWVLHWQVLDVENQCHSASVESIVVTKVPDHSLELAPKGNLQNCKQHLLYKYALRPFCAAFFFPRLLSQTKAKHVFLLIASAIQSFYEKL